MNRWSLMVLTLSFCAVGSARAQQSPSLSADADPEETAVLSNEEAVKTLVNRFLLAIGSYDLEALPPMFTENANIGAVNFSDGQWHTRTYTFDEFHSILKARVNPSPYQEPVSHFTIHVEDGGLAFVRADATLMRDNQPRSHNIDYFTLVKEDGVWKFLSASYVATPITKQ